jgi:hypothetical protein
MSYIIQPIKRFYLALLGFCVLGFFFLSPAPERSPAEAEQNSYDPLTLKDGRWTLNSHRQASLKRGAIRFGISSQSFVDFYASLRDKTFSENTDSLKCFKDFVDSNAARTALLKCMSQKGRSSLSDAVYEKLFDMRQDRIQSPQADLETHKTLALLAWLEDLVRARRLEQGLAAAWYVKGEGFVDITHHADFPYQDGDVLLVLGGSSISSVITQSTFPQRKYSHALMMQVRDQEPVTMESLIETGLIAKQRINFLKIN